MGVQPWCEGPNLIWFGFGPTGPLKYFGTAAHAPRPRHQFAYKPLPNDVAGHINPFDLSYQGQAAAIFMSMSRWDYSVYLAAHALISDVPGLDSYGDMGTLMNFEGVALRVGIQFPYRRFSVFSGMPGGYIYNFCVVESNDINEEGGTEGQICGITVRAYSSFRPDGSLKLYDVATSSTFPTNVAL